MKHKLYEYKNVELDSRVWSASPHGLISIILEAILTQITKAQQACINQDIAQQGLTTSKAIELIDYLRSCLNFNAAPEIANHLDALYEFSSRNLLHANLKKNSTMFEDTRVVIANIKKAWDGISG